MRVVGIGWGDGLGGWGLVKLNGDEGVNFVAWTPISGSKILADDS